MKKLNLVRKTLTSIAFGTSLMLAFVFAAQAQTPTDTQQTQQTQALTEQTQQTQVSTQETQVTTQQTQAATQQTQQTTQQTQDTTPMFSDIPIGSTHYYAIKYLKDHNIIHGYDDGTFRSNKEINRAEALKIILGAISKDPQKKDVPTFEDVKETAWFYPFVLQGYQNEIIKGYPDELFHPEQTITRVEALKMALLQENKAIPTDVTVRPYSDVPIDVWYTPYAKVSKDRGLFVETRTNGGQL
ncbi:MAG: S-layer homology domain-containing protein, partial [Candidatus Gracilibacteria bacterium]